MHDSSSHAARASDTTSTVDHRNEPSNAGSALRRKRRLTALATAVVAAGSVLPAAAMTTADNDTAAADISPQSEIAEPGAQSDGLHGPDDLFTGEGAEVVRTVARSTRVSRSVSGRPALEARATDASERSSASHTSVNRPGPKLRTPIPAPGSRHRHSGGYPGARWAGDINVPGSRDHGNPVRSVGAGRVTEVHRWSYSYGHHVVIGDELYAHLSRIKVRKGQRVHRGQLIGRVGSTGNSSGPHLHFETGRK